MTTGQEKTTQALQYAIQMEIDGKAFYLKASRESGNELGRKLLESLAAQEDYHRQKFEQIDENIRKSRNWPAVDFIPDGGKTLRTIFAVEISKPTSEIKVAQTELDAVQKAMQIEDKSYDLYHTDLGKLLKVPNAIFMKRFLMRKDSTNWFSSIIMNIYRIQPAWFVKSEHTSLDGGN